MKIQLSYRCWDPISSTMYYDIQPFGSAWNEILKCGGTGMQSTGLHDKNGKEIYTGDIVRQAAYGDWNDLSDIYEFEIESLQEFFENKGYNECELGYSYDSKDLEIIGNRFKNPNLLGTK